MTARLGQLVEFNARKDSGLEPDPFAREPTPPRRQLVGELLRETREKYRQDLETVSAELRIRMVYLKAIEDSRYDALPGPTYASGFLRSYADYLGLNAKDLLRRFRDEVAALQPEPESAVEEEPELPAEDETPARRVPVRAILLGSVVGIVIAVAAWAYLSGRSGSVLQAIPDVPEKLKALVASGGGSKPAEPPATDSVPQQEIAPPASASAAAGAGEASQAPASSQAAQAPAVAEDGPAIGSSAAAVPSPTVADSSASSALVPPADEATALDVESTALPVPPLKPPPPSGLAEDSGSMAVAEVAGTGQAAATAGGRPGLIAESTTRRTEGVGSVGLAPTASAVPAAPAVPSSPAVPDGQAPSVPAPPGVGQAAGLTAMAAIPSAPADAPGKGKAQTFGAANAGSRVLLYARLESWIQITDADNAPLWTRVLRAGDSYLLPDQQGLTLATGNAGGLDIYVDGKKVPPLGPVGVERRSVVLDPERLKAGTAGP